MKQLHKYLGWLMLLPFIAWAITGVFFFIKPGYQEAYASLAVKQYPLQQSYYMAGNPNWQEVRLLRSVLGDHLLVKANDKWQQLDPHSLTPIAKPSQSQVRKLVEDAMQSNPERYGDIASIDGLNITTTTDVRITLNWQQMSLYQQGEDTDFINQMYQIHYLQWTGIKPVDKVLGIVGLGLVLLLAGVGLWLSLRPRVKVD